MVTENSFKLLFLLFPVVAVHASRDMDERLCLQTLGIVIFCMVNPPLKYR